MIFSSMNNPQPGDREFCAENISRYPDFFDEKALFYYTVSICIICINRFWSLFTHPKYLIIYSCDRDFIAGG